MGWSGEHRGFVVETFFKNNEYLIATQTQNLICSFTKPGVCTNQIVHCHEMEFISLGRKDGIVINGGTNDIGNNSTTRNETLVMMTQSMHKYNNTNILFVYIPQ